MTVVTLEWLETQAKQLVRKHWKINHIPKIAIDLDRKLDWDKCVGFYCNDIKTVAFNSEVNKRRALKDIKRTLLHELCHWHLHTTGQRFRDSDERFARELIRVGLGNRHNKDEQATLAAKQARKQKKREYFEIYEVDGSEILVSRMRHHRKNQEDFRYDLAQTLIKLNNEREDENESIYPADVADRMSKLYGYKVDPLAVYGINLSANDGLKSNDIGNREDIEHLLINLDVDTDVIDKKLKNVASEQ